MDYLIASKSKAGVDATTDGIKWDVGHAPLLPADIATQYWKDLVPQFGLIGSQSEATDQVTKIGQNTNVPYSAFICGVQGSGKSHTTACMLEKALIPSLTLRVLQSPMSALVFSYGQSQTGLGGFDVSETVHLAASRPDFPGHCVEIMTVMVSPTNLAMRICYENQGRDIRVLPFWVNAKTLDISVLRTLMAVDDKAVILYMAQVESVLSEIGASSRDGSLDYKFFKDKLLQKEFDTVQSRTLKQRLDLLESFLDLSGNAAEPQYLPGEMIIMDLTDPNLTAITA
jgi:hypothetical protein